MHRFSKEADGIYRLRVPFESIYTCVFLIEAQGKKILVDCAMTEDDVEDVILPALEKMGYAPTDVDTLDTALAQLDGWWDYMNAHSLLAKGSLYNVNFPRELPFKGVCLTYQGGEFYSDAFEYRGNDLYMQTGAPVHYDRCDLSIDIDAVRAGYISVTPMTFNKTDWNVLKALTNPS